MTLARRLVAEGVGSLLLAATVIGSGIMAERLAAGNAAVALLANTMFELPLWQVSTHARDGGPQWLGELVATFGLLLVVLGVRADRVAWSVAAAVARYLSLRDSEFRSAHFGEPGTLRASSDSARRRIRPAGRTPSSPR